MHEPSLRAALTGLLVLALSALADSAHAQASALNDARGAISGSWYNPAQSGHGLMLERLSHGRVALSWYSYRRDGSPFWLVAVGTQHGARVDAQAFQGEGGQPPPHWSQASPDITPWGTLRIEFDGCNAAVLHWTSSDPDFGNGHLPLQRLTGIDALRCDAENEFGLHLGYSFQLDWAGFGALFADLPQDPPDIYEIDARWERLPEPLHSRAGIRLTGHNRSDDLAMLIKAPIHGLVPDTRYRVELEAELASNVPTGCVGVGGSPGDSVYLKLGASRVEPQAIAQNEGDETMLRLNIDFGSQSQSGEDARVVGTLANSADCSAGVQAAWELKSVSTEGMAFTVRSDAQGRIWVFAGSDSAFEGLTRFYFTALRVRLQPEVDP